MNKKITIALILMSGLLFALHLPASAPFQAKDNTLTDEEKEKRLGITV